MGFGVKLDGQQFLLENDLQQRSLTFGLYNEANNPHPRDGDETDLGGEPTNYTPVDESVTIKLVNDNYQFSTDAQIEIDVIDATETVDAYYAVDASTGTFLLTADLLDPQGGSRTVDLSEVDQLNITDGAGGTFVEV
jgi:hypothetical protein